LGEVPGPAGRAIPSDSKAVVLPWSGRASAKVLRQPFDPAFLCGKTPRPPQNPFPPGFLIHPPPRRVILADKLGMGEQRKTIDPGTEEALQS